MQCFSVSHSNKLLNLVDGSWGPVSHVYEVGAGLWDDALSLWGLMLTPENQN